MTTGSWRRSQICVAVLLAAPVTGTQLWSQTDAAKPESQTAGPTQAQTPRIPTFAVISVRRNITAQGWRDGPTADGYSASAVTVNWILPEAYGIYPSFRIFGAPDWAGIYRYDIQAKVDDADIAALGTLDSKQRYSMIQQILEQRFKIKVHRENRPQPIYSLVVARPERLHETPPPADGKPPATFTTVTRGRAGQLTVTNVTMEGFASMMSGRLGRVVVDNTGLSGHYDVKLDWTPNEDDPADTGPAPSIFTAVQEQLGLKLVPTTAPVECLVIDHVEPPTEN